MHIPIKNKTDVKDVDALFVDKNDFKLKVKKSNNLIVYSCEELNLEIPDDPENGGSSSGSENVEFEGGDAKFVYRITDAEYEDMNGYYYFDEANSRRNHIIYKNSETNATIDIFEEEISVSSSSNIITSGPCYEMFPGSGLILYKDYDEETISSLKIDRINKFYLADGTYCKLIVSDAVSNKSIKINGEYYCAPELKNLLGNGHDVFICEVIYENREYWDGKFDTNFIMYTYAGETDSDMTSDGYAIVSNWLSQEPFFYNCESSTNVEGTYKFANYPGWAGYNLEDKYPKVEFDKK